jgi:diguanylate cyclase (GGDEF)-like protein
MPEIPKSPFLEEEDKTPSPAEPTRIGGRPRMHSSGQPLGDEELAPASEGSLRGFLTVLVGDQVGRMYDLSKPVVVIGRGKTCDICIESEGVSRSHARIVRHGGEYLIEDLGSTNGTWVDGAAPSGRPLRRGARIRIGTYAVVRFTMLTDFEAAQQFQSYESGILDRLTGVYNRRHFDQSLAGKVEQAADGGSPVALVLVQIDDMKGINDYYTEAGGDTLLVEVAKLLRETAPPEALVFRTGADEFGIIGSPMSHHRAVMLAEEIRGAIEQLEVLWQSGDFSMYIQQITARLSVTTPDQLPRATGAEIVEEATARLARARGLGGNTVVSS